jgi:hypothetical protein
VTHRNVTITLDEETAVWLRIEAARRDTSVSKLVGSLLRRGMAEDQQYEPAMRSFLARGIRPLKQAGTYPARDTLHSRADLR